MSIADRFRRATLESGRSLPTLLLEAAKLRLSASHLGFSEYLNFRLHLPDLDMRQKRQFVGGFGALALKDLVADERARFIVRDKVTTHVLLQGYGFPTPALKAVYLSSRPHSLPCLKSAQALIEFLRDPRNLPVYLKPSRGTKGEGNALLLACEGDHLRLGDGSEVNLLAFVSGMSSGRTMGWLLQEPLRAHPALQTLTGTDKVSSIRICTVHDGRTVRAYRAVLKINRGDRDNDDFQHGILGNAVGAIDLATGRVTRVVLGLPDVEQIDPPHPKTGQPTAGFQIPHWDEVIRMVEDAHHAIPTLVCPHWDVAVTDKGPVFLEINSFGSLAFLQRAHRRGFADEELLAMLRRRGKRGMLDPDMLRIDPVGWARRLGWLRRYWTCRMDIPYLRYRDETETGD